MELDPALGSLGKVDLLLHHRTEGVEPTMIFPWVWKLLPGNKALKAIQVVAILAAGSALLLFVIFPALDALLLAPPVVVEQ